MGESGQRQIRLNVNRRDASSEVMEVSEAKGCTFEGFGGVVDAFGETIGEVTIEGVEDIHLPVCEHS